jgi:hypothetical protein
MSFRADSPASYVGEVIGDGHCVAYVRLAADTPHTSQWRRGERVHDVDHVPPGTVIATFGKDGRYENRTDGSSHAAILVMVQNSGLQVWDQWVGHPVAIRVIRFKGRQPPACDDGDQFYVVEGHVG